MNAKLLGIVVLGLLLMPLALADSRTCQEMGGRIVSGECDEGEQAINLDNVKCCLSVPPLPEPPRAGIGGGLGNLFERLRYGLTFDKAKKIELGLQMAEKRMALIQQRIEQGKLSEAESQIQEYNALMEQARIRLQELNNEKTKEGQERVLAKLARIEQRLELQAAKMEGVKNAILERMEARNMTNIEHVRQVFARIEQKREEIAQKLTEQKQASLQKYKALSGSSDAVLAQVRTRIENEAGLNETKKLRAALAIGRAEGQLNRVRERLEGLNQSNVSQQLQTQQRLLERLKQRLREGGDGKITEEATSIQNRGQQISAIAQQIRVAEREQRREAVQELLNKVSEITGNPSPGSAGQGGQGGTGTGGGTGGSTTAGNTSTGGREMPPSPPTPGTGGRRP